MRQIIQIQVSPNSRGLYALCNDGTVFIGRWSDAIPNRTIMQWEQLPDVPQDMPQETAS